MRLSQPRVHLVAGSAHCAPARHRDGPRNRTYPTEGVPTRECEGILLNLGVVGGRVDGRMDS